MDSPRTNHADLVAGANKVGAAANGAGNGGKAGGADGPVLPIFVQLNVRFLDKDTSWREASR